MNTNHFKISEANMLFLVLAFVFLTLGAYVQSVDTIIGLIITEYGILLLPILIYAWATKKDIKRVFRLKKIPFKVAILIVVMALFLVPVIALVNLLALFIIELFSTSVAVPIPTATSLGDLILYLFVISFTAGICEEFFFRGMVLNAYENEVDMKRAVIFSAVLFGIFHFNPQNLLGPITLGLIFGYLVQLTGSIWAGVIAHAANNAVAVIIGFVVNLSSNGVSSEYVEGFQAEPVLDAPEVILGVIVFYAILSIASFVGVKAMLSRIMRYYPRYEVGDTVLVKAKPYEIITVEDETLHIEPRFTTSGPIVPMVTDLQRLKEVKAVSRYKIWRGDGIRVNALKLLPLAVTLIFYGYVIYSVYVVGV